MTEQLVEELFAGKLSANTLFTMCGGFEKFKELIANLYERAIATYDAFEKNQPKVDEMKSAFFIGMYFYHLSEDTKSFEIGARWLKAMADQGFAPAQYWLGECYQNIAGGWFENAPHVFLGVNYDQFENGYSQLERDGANWFEKAANQGFGVAQYRLGYCYIGIGRERSRTTSRMWLRKAADQGVVEAIQLVNSM